MPVLGSDSLGACSSLIDQALTFVDAPKTITSVAYTYEWGTDEWNADPCCNWELHDKMCCAPRETIAMVPEAKVDTKAMASYCADDIKQLTTAVYAAKAFTKARKQSTDQTKGCAAHRETKIASYAPYRDVGKNCSDVVMGSWENDWKSSQVCTKDSDCYTKNCIAAATGEKIRYCQTSNEPEYLTWCLFDKLKNKHKALSKTRAFFANGNARASPLQVGEGITEVAGRSMCMGPDGWRYNPDWKECKTFDTTTYECTEYYCGGEDDCKTKCESSGMNCNANPWEDWDEIKCENDKLRNGGKFCGRCWGGVTTDDSTGVKIGSDCHEESWPSECRAHMDRSSVGAAGGWTLDSCQKYFGSTSTPNTEAYVRQPDYEDDTNNWCELPATSVEECNPGAACDDAGFNERWACVVEEVPSGGFSQRNVQCDSDWCDDGNDNCCDWWENKFNGHHYNTKWTDGGHKWVEVRLGNVNVKRRV